MRAMEKELVNQCRCNMSATSRKAEERKGAETESGKKLGVYFSKCSARTESRNTGLRCRLLGSTPDLRIRAFISTRRCGCSCTGLKLRSTALGQEAEPPKNKPG